MVSVVGTVSGAFSWILSHPAEITTIAGMIGAVCSALISLLALLRVVIGVIRRRRRNRRARLEHAAYDVPFDGGMHEDDPEDFSR